VKESGSRVPEWATSQFEGDAVPKSVVLQGSPNVDSGGSKKERIFVEASKANHGIYPQTNATIALVLSIAGLVVLGPCTAIPGVILATGALKNTSQYPGHPDHGIARAAQIIGWIVIVISILGIFLLAFVFGFAVLWSV